MQARPGPTPGVTLTTSLRRPAAALTLLAVAAATLTTAPPVGKPAASASTCAPRPSTCAQDLITPPLVDEAVEVRDLVASERASRHARPAVQAAGAVPQPAKPVRAQPQPPRKTATAKPPKRPGGTSGAAPVRAAGNLAVVIRYALAQVGDRYVWGASGPDAWDCSALSMQAYAQIGIRLPHQSGAQMRYGTPVTRAQLRPGDLIFWATNGRISHLAISLGGNRMVHAANPRKGVLVASIYGAPVGYRRLVG